jgi:hypothetical protein
MVSLRRRISCDQFRTHGTSYWLLGMSWYSRRTRRQLSDEFLLAKSLWQAESESLIEPPLRATPATVTAFWYSCSGFLRAATATYWLSCEPLPFWFMLPRSLFRSSEDCLKYIHESSFLIRPRMLAGIIIVAFLVRHAEFLNCWSLRCRD